MTPARYPLTISASASVIERWRYASSAVTVRLSVRVTVLPAMPLRLGPTPAAPESEWQAEHPSVAYRVLPRATRAVVTGTGADGGAEGAAGVVVAGAEAAGAAIE